MAAFIFCLLLLSISNQCIESKTIEIFINNIEFRVDARESTEVGTKWALLVAGSSGYGNYRHQADVCHAYQLLKTNGIKEENIIVMMYDDIAYNEDNPTPGIIINYPNGKDVYKGVKKDYIGTTVTPENFLSILKGDADAMKGIGTGRVIKSGSNDLVFVFFSGHGGPGILGFPNSILPVADLISTLKFNAANKRFHKMVMYVEACESGSMFQQVLPDNLDIFVMTASDPKESSYACYWDVSRHIYLGDLFSVMWLQEAEKENLSIRSLNHLFQQVRTNTNESHVEEYGDLDIGNTNISEIIGHHGDQDLSPAYFISPHHDAVPALDVPLMTLQKKYEKARGQKRKALKAEIVSTMGKRKDVEKLMETILLKLSKPETLKMNELQNNKPEINEANMHCYSDVIKSFSKKCINIAKNPYVIRFIGMFVNACSANWLNKDEILMTVNETCRNGDQIIGAV